MTGASISEPGVVAPVSIAQGGTGQATAAAGLAALGGLVKVADTGAAGFTLQNGTPTILTWTAPNDGNDHSVLSFANVNVTSAETGGAVNLTATDPGNGAINTGLDGGAHGAGIFVGTTKSILVKAGTTVSVVQSSALTAGAAVLYCSLWAL